MPSGTAFDQLLAAQKAEALVRHRPELWTQWYPGSSSNFLYSTHSGISTIIILSKHRALNFRTLLLQLVLQAQDVYTIKTSSRSFITKAWHRKELSGNALFVPTWQRLQPGGSDVTCGQCFLRSVQRAQACFHRGLLELLEP